MDVRSTWKRRLCGSSARPPMDAGHPTSVCSDFLHARALRADWKATSMDCTSALSVTVHLLRKPPDLVYPITFTFSSRIRYSTPHFGLLAPRPSPTCLRLPSLISSSCCFSFCTPFSFLSALQLVFLSFCILFFIHPPTKKTSSSNYPCMTYTIKTKLNKLLEKKIDMLHWGINDEN